MSVLFGLAALGFATTTFAHGTVSGIVADGTYYSGWQLQNYYTLQNQQAIPETPGWYAENLDNGFIDGTGYTTPDIICHKNAKNANSSATVKAGGTVAFQWTAWPASHVGPVITYLADCGADCSTVDKTTLAWFKIDAGGYDNGKWASDTMIEANNTWTTTIPASIKAGNYVARHEIIALHSAGTANGAQNYPQCLNLVITGGGSDSPAGTLGEKLYTPTDAGIVFNVYSSSISYTVPGPALFSGGSSNTNPTTPVASATPSAVIPSAAVPTKAAASATANPTPTGTGTVGAEKTFTLTTFIAWLEEQSATLTRRHARDF